MIFFADTSARTDITLDIPFSVVVMGNAGSWLATFCWVIASSRLPLALSAQLIIAETVFGLAHGLMFEERLPSTP
jgi:hypothetical protein